MNLVIVDINMQHSDNNNNNSYSNNKGGAIAKVIMTIVKAM